MSIPAVYADLWPRLAKLDQCCQISAVSRFDQDGRLWWLVTVRRRRNGAPPVRVEAASLAEALYDAVIQAEATGWPN